MTRLGYVGYKYSTVLIGQLKRAREVLRAPLSLASRAALASQKLSLEQCSSYIQWPCVIAMRPQRHLASCLRAVSRCGMKNWSNSST